MDFQVVLFDLDGTLADSLPLILNTNERVFQELGLPWQAEAVLEMIGLGLAEIARRLAGDRADDFVRLYRSHLYQDYDRLMRPFPWIIDGLTALGQLGLRLGVVTSKGREATGRPDSLLYRPDRFFRSGGDGRRYARPQAAAWSGSTGHGGHGGGAPRLRLYR